jgi:hypothetical protein
MIPGTSGVLPRAVIELYEKIRFNKAERVNIYLSIYQIYNEQIYDLLQDPEMEKALKIRENRHEGIFVEGMTEYMISNAEDALSLLRQGQNNRSIRSTHMNNLSSRSHTVFQFVMEGKRGNKSIKSKLNIVDLAGSEKWNLGVKMDDIHIAELTKINLRSVDYIYLFCIYNMCIIYYDLLYTYY